MYSADIQKTPRQFIPSSYAITDWPSLEPYFEELLHRPITTAEELKIWIENLSELQAIISEDACWRQIKMTCNTEDPSLEEAFTYFCMEIEPYIKPYADKLNRKLIECPLLSQLDTDRYKIYLRTIEKDIKLYREENIALLAEINVLSQQYGSITGKMSIHLDGKEYTLQQAAKFLMQSNRTLREKVYHLVNQRRLEDTQALNTLFDQLLALRHQVARNAGYDNYRDYKFAELGRFDYSVEDCYTFHQAIKEYIMPLVDILYQNKKKQLQLDTLKPYDVDAEPAGQEPLAPFEQADELLQKSIHVFKQLKPYFGECLEKMNALGHFDLESRKGKAPGGYNCPLAETGAPFIFMNAAGTADDVVTMMHEGGHALHSFLSHSLPISADKEYPMEMAELASMSMELFSMEHWDTFYPDPSLLRRARTEELERVLSIFPWIAIIDKFQHWLYTHPTHTASEREAQWLAIHAEFTSPHMDWQGLESYRANLWQKQLHLFEVPFYYIEYGIAQLGALAMWQQYKQHKEQALDRYMYALSLGGTRTLPELYQAAGINFDFSPSNIQALSEFVKQELLALS